MSKNVLSVRNLKKIYPGKKDFIAVDDISFDLGKGEILGLLGPNGAGKTTTIQMLMSTLKPTSGMILYFGKDFFKHRSEILKKVAFSSTYVSMPWNLTVRQNLEVFGRLYGVKGELLTKRIDELLERFGIAKKKQDKVASLSSGQITRLMLIKAFIVKPEIVLLDEPTASLDPDVAKEVCDFVLEQRENEGTSILFTSHNMKEVSKLCDRLLFLQQGQIIANDVPAKLAKSVSHCKVQIEIGDGMKRSISIAEGFKFPYFTNQRSMEIHLEEYQISQLLIALSKADIDYTNISIIQPTLEDYFLHMASKTDMEGR